MKSLIVLLISVFLLLPAYAEPTIKVGLVPVKVEGSFKPLSSEQATNLLLEGLQAKNTRSELSLIEGSSPMPIGEAVKLAEAKGLDMIIWGEMRFKKASFTSRGDLYYRGRQKLAVSTVGDLKVVWVPEKKLVLSQPTIVTSSTQTLDWVLSDTGHLSEEQSMAANAIKDVADSLVRVVRKRHHAGWFQTP